MSFMSLYVHFPFCESKCHYCDFYSLGRERTRPDDPGKFARALRTESRLRDTALDSEIRTIFFGGGTPSMTPADQMAESLAPLGLSSRITSATEWTMEANPSSIERETLPRYRALGINRISMGVQSLQPALLEKLGRVHSRERAFESLEAVFDAGFTNVSVDVLCGVPGQSLNELAETLESLTRFPVTHLSCYLLTLSKFHRMFPDLPADHSQLEHFLFLDQFMRDRGFEHYEISNFAKPGFRARHNLAYWTGESYLGMGPSAHSFDRRLQRRWKNVSSLHKYSEELIERGKLPMEWDEELTPEQQDLEKWMLALRLSDGFPVSWLTTEGQRVRARVMEREGLLESHPGDPDRKRLTARGYALSDQVISSLV